jgi:hypothetical protein
VDAVRTVLTSQIVLRGESVPQPPADLFVPVQREASDHESDRPPTPAGRGPDEAQSPKDRPGARLSGLRPTAIVAVLLVGLLGVVAIATFPEPDRAMTPPAPSVSSDQPLDDTPQGGTTPGDTTQGDTTQGSGMVGITAVAEPPGTSVSLPGPSSRDWVAPGARSDGALVRADLAEESIEFRAANTQPGLPGAFRLSWTGGTPHDERGDATAMLGVRPGGWVAFVVRQLSSPAELVVHLSGNDVGVTVATEQGSTREIVSAGAAVATVTLPAATAATVTVTAEGGQDVAVATAELQDPRSTR